jgi:hypothetical protein
MSKAKDWDHNCTGADCTVTGCESASMARELKASANKPTTDDLEDFRGFCRNASAAQLLVIYRKEKDAGRDEYAQVARWVAEERGVMLDEVR